jgi:hypothetical protein
VWLSVVGGIVGRNSLWLVLGMEILFALTVEERVFNMPSHYLMVMLFAGQYLNYHWFVTPAKLQQVIRNDPGAGVTLSIEEEIEPSLNLLVEGGFLELEKGDNKFSCWNRYRRFIPRLKKDDVKEDMDCQD